MFIAVDFDGTVVTHEYPDIGTPIPGALETLKELQEAGHQIILWTMRSDSRNTGLFEAVNYLTNNGIELFGINENPTQDSWSTSSKAYAHVYIDDAALGCPLIYDTEVSERPFVDWSQIKALLQERGLFPPTV